jgi:RNA polymerase sigma factor (sigma-70 family)
MSTGRADERSAHIDEILEQYDPFIVAHMREQVCQDPALMRAVTRDMEIDDLAQLVRIKFWHALQEKEITYPKAYIRRIVNSEIVDMMRRLKVLPMALPEDEEGEIYAGKVLVTPSEEMADPAEVVEQQEAATCRMREVAGAVVKLPERQQHAMICTLRDRVDNLLLLMDAFEKQGYDLKRWEWPEIKREKVLLQASLSYARRSVTESIAEGKALQAQYLPSLRRGRRKRIAVAAVGRGCQR